MNQEGSIHAEVHLPAKVAAKGGRMRAFFKKGPAQDFSFTTRVRMNLHTVSWFGLCCTMGYAGAVQANGAAYLLAFMTGALGVMSYVYARANLRGLEVRVGAAPVQLAGKGEVLPVELRASYGHAPCGIEVILVGAPESSFVEEVVNGQPVRLHLRMPPAGQPLRLLLRSAYPLGLLKAQRLVNVELTRHAVPAASGDLALPQGTVLSSGSDGRSGGYSPPSREGDDFAGVREWQPGDSPRHIDWRAVARGRPLMVKTWAKGTSEAVAMDWETLPLPVAERAGQMVRWIQMCEQQGLSYSLKLPGQEISAGQGESHARRCLAALAELHAGGATSAETPQSARVPASYERRIGVPRGPLGLLSAVLFMTVLPLQDLVAVPVLVLFFLSLSYRSLIARPLKHRWLPLSVTALGVAGLYFTQGDLLSMEAGIALLIVLSGGKMLESRSPHDFQVMAMIGWFLCLCGLLADQSIGRAVLMFGAYALITGCMVRFRRGVVGWKIPARQTTRLLLQALPMVVILFVIFPRVSLDSLVRLGSRRTTVTGIPTSLDPGKVLQIAKNTERAFRVEFPEGVIPSNNQRYWRCVVLWDCWGLSWNRGLGLSYGPRIRQAEAGDIRQTITLEPHGQTWLPALDYPVYGTDGRADLTLHAERLLSAHEPVRKQRRLNVLSRPQLVWEPLPESHRLAALQVPRDFSVNLRSLAEQWRQASANDQQVVEAGLNYLRTQGFKYTMEPGTYLGPGALEEFVLRRRIGFCEHFSAAFASLMRAAGVPSRVIMGYQGGEMSMTGTHLIVRQSDAHSWTEVWLEGAGWTRIDPTAVLAPGRVNQGLQSFMLGGEEELERQRDTWWWQIRERTELFWDQVNDQWYQVISFDEESQFGWLSWLGVSGAQQVYLLLGSFFIVLLLLGILNLWLRRPARDTDAWRLAWERLCRHLEGLGMPARRANEGPQAYALRIASERPQVMELAQQYAESRYGTKAASLTAFKKAVRLLR
ncbi:transglutaminase-like putative cysteine protease [Prosthecobacter fusiformis]|uniref:Transglutaminase-like putative cysteine protease n=1 Tax=Prosthecobacter fusiformis TaxID=48464 RepID=A0A4R7RTJ6_9BACT|nr:transglutaminaseTgpA domain-containing protein [Prosthecobacter fusiformis]TDU68146.1 transglutaminase-like putative cysteine protease [Prosthecobacter fusiformis]